MHHLEGDARFDQRLVPAKSMVLNLRFGVFLAVVPSRLLGIDQSDSREGLLVREVLLILFRPKIDFFNAPAKRCSSSSMEKHSSPSTDAHPC
jgi:hypothetical protein